MSCALFWSGGKDSLLALDRARRSGLNVTHLVNVYEGNSGRVRFHGVPRRYIQAQADALGLSLVQRRTHPLDFDGALSEALTELREAGVRGVVFGNIHLADIRAWYEQRTQAAGFEHFEPLWGDPPAVLIREFVERGHQARIVSVNLSCGRAEWLGRDFDASMIAALEAAAPADVCGERGEYHSFSYGGPMFRHPLRIEATGSQEIEGHLILEFQLEFNHADRLLEKLEEQVERATRLLELIPPDRLEWRPEYPALQVRELAAHLSGTLAGFCAVLQAAFPKQLAHFEALRGRNAPLPELMICIREGFALIRDDDLARPIRTVFVPRGEALLTLLLGNLEHFINHKYQLFVYLKMLGVEAGTPDLYRLRGGSPSGP